MTWCPEELQVVTSACSLQVEVVMEVVLHLIMYSLPFTYKPPKVSSGGRGRLPWWLSGKESTCQCRRRGFNPWVRKFPWRRKWQPTPTFLPGKFHGQRTVVVYSSWGCKRGRHDLATKQLHRKEEGDPHIQSRSDLGQIQEWSLRLAGFSRLGKNWGVS